MNKRVVVAALIVTILGALGIALRANIFKDIKKGFEEKISKPFERDVIKPVEEKVIKPIEEKVIKPAEQALRPLFTGEPELPNLPKIQVAGIDLNDEDRVIKTFAPLLKFNEGEKYFPSSMEWLIRRTSLRKGRQILIPRGQLTPQKLADYISKQTKNDGLDLHLDLADNDANYKEETYRGVQPVNNQILSPCYVNYRIISPNEAIIQMYFVYPFNEPTPLLQAGKPLVGLKAIKTVGSHEGDVENVDIYLTKKGNLVTLDKMFFARHGAHGKMVNGTNIERVQYTHPVVYVAKYGHASYEAPIPLVNQLADTADGKGPVWETWKHFELLGPDNDPIVPTWARFKGAIGTQKSVNPNSRGTGGSPRAPYGRGDWKKDGKAPRRVIRY